VTRTRPFRLRARASVRQTATTDPFSFPTNALDIQLRPRSLFLTPSSTRERWVKLLPPDSVIADIRLDLGQNSKIVHVANLLVKRIFEYYRILFIWIRLHIVVLAFWSRSAYMLPPARSEILWLWVKLRANSPMCSGKYIRQGTRETTIMDNRRHLRALKPFQGNNPSPSP